MNKLFIIGNLTKNPDTRQVQDGLTVCTFTVAVNRPGRKAQGQGADFFRVTAWRTLGETCAKYLEKGRKVCVIGQVGLDEWEKDGRHGAALAVTADTVEFLSTRAGDTAAPADAAPADRTAGLTPVAPPDDLPF